MLRIAATHFSSMKILLTVIGSIAVALAVLGLFLPLLPTTPFLLLASACYVRGSERMHRRLLDNPVFGEYLRNFEAGKGIPRRAKLIALTLLWASLLFSIQQFRIVPLQIVLAAIGTAVSIYLLKMKTLDKHAAGNATDINQ